MYFELNIVTSIFSFFNQFPTIIKILNLLTTILPFLLVISTLLIAFLQRRYILICFYMACNIIGFLIKEIISFFFLRPRPYDLLGVNVSTNLTANSFYSTHTFVAFTSAFFICFLTKKKWAKVLGFLLAISTAFTRIALAQHYISDILAGFLVAMILYLIAKKSYEKYFLEDIR